MNSGIYNWDQVPFFPTIHCNISLNQSVFDSEITRLPKASEFVHDAIV